MPTHVLGISSYYHDSAACLVTDGRVVAAAQEERFSRRRHDASFPRQAVRYCLEAAGVEVGGLARVVFYEMPLLKLDRLLETYAAFAPRGLRSFRAALGTWAGGKLYQGEEIGRELLRLSDLDDPDGLPPLHFVEHHASHAASAFLASPFPQAAVLCMDGVGEWATTSAWTGRGSELRALWEIRFPHSLGLLYSAFTQHAGFRVNSGEYKLMGLAPYGRPSYATAIRDHLLDVKDDGSFRLNLEFFDFCTGTRMTNPRFAELFGPARAAEAELTQRDMDLARSVQEVLEEVVLRLARALHAETGADALCLAGGVALNCVANGRVLREGPFARVWVQPASGDAGGALGCALLGWHDLSGAPREPDGRRDAMRGALLGPSYDNERIGAFLRAERVPHHVLDDERLFGAVAGELAAGRVVGWFQGRMEFGPRALGARSILADPRDPGMQRALNLKIKYRESFRPFAPAVPRERAAELFDLDCDSPYMLLVAGVRPGAALPAVTHVDGSARVQTVDAETSPRFHALLRAFADATGCPVLVNTSFNVRGEPIVCTPADAYRCFLRTEMDVLVLENHLVRKRELDSGTPRPAPGPAGLD